MKGDVVVNRLRSTFSVHVRITKRFRWRCWLALRLIKLGVHLMPMNVRWKVDADVEEEEGPDHG